MALSPSDSGRLHVLNAVEEGWRAFCRAPWSFLLFQLLASLVLLPFVALAVVGAARLVELELAELEGLMLLPSTGAWLALIVGVIGYVIVVIWNLVGLTRGAWISLNGDKPSFADFTRWNRPAATRLLGATVLLAIVVALAGVIATLVSTGLGRFNTALSIIPLVVMVVFTIWLAISQKFLLQVSLFGCKQPLDCLGSGVNVVTPNWGMVLWLVIVETAIQMIGALFSYGGLVVAVPVLLCVSTAAYRQLFGAEDRTGLLS